MFDQLLDEMIDESERESPEERRTRLQDTADDYGISVTQLHRLDHATEELLQILREEKQEDIDRLRQEYPVAGQFLGFLENPIVYEKTAVALTKDPETFALIVRTLHTLMERENLYSELDIEEPNPSSLYPPIDSEK